MSAPSEGRPDRTVGPWTSSSAPPPSTRSPDSVTSSATVTVGSPATTGSRPDSTTPWPRAGWSGPGTEGRLWVAVSSGGGGGAGRRQMMARSSVSPWPRRSTVRPTWLRSRSGSPSRAGEWGGRLVEAVCRWARDRSFGSVTLCTFTDVGWNRPLYEHLGFVVVPEEQWTTGCAGRVRDRGRTRARPGPPGGHGNVLPTGGGRPPLPWRRGPGPVTQADDDGGGPVARYLYRWGVTRWIVGALVVGTVAATAVVTPVAGPAGAAVALAPFRGHGSIDEAYVLGARPGRI